MEINHKEFEKVLDVNRKARKSVLVKGASGIGKSLAVESYYQDLAKAEGREYLEWNVLSVEEKRELVDNEDLRKASVVFADVRVSLMDPGDFRLPYINGKPYAEWRPGVLFHFLSLPGTMAALFMDELTHANPSMQAAAFQVVHNRAVGDVSFNDDVFIVAAGNRTEDRAGAFDMLLPLRGRFSNYTLRSPTVDEWVEWAAMNGVDGRIIAFLKFAPSHLADKVEDALKVKDQGFACCRTWTDAGDLIKGIKIDFDEGDDVKREKLDLLKMVVAGRVGEGHAMAFEKFVKTGVKVDLDTLLKYPEKAARLDLDGKWTVVGGLAEVYRSSPKKLNAVLGVLGHIDDDLAVASLSMIMNYDCGKNKSNKVGFVNKVMACENAPIFRKYSKYFSGV